LANILPSLSGWSTTEASNQPDSTDSATITGDLRAIQAGIRYVYSQDTIASAATTDLGSKDSGYLTISGTTTITSLGTVSAGINKRCVFSGALILTHNATSLILPGAANITTVAGDVLFFESLGSGNWRCIAYLPTTGGVVTTTNAVTLTNKTLTSPTINTPTINTVAAVGGAWTAAATWTLPAITLGGTVTLNGQSFSGTCANGGTFTTIDINGGTVDGTIIGGSSAAAGTFTTLTATGNAAIGDASSDVHTVKGQITVTTASGLGYGTGSGGSVTQLTSKSTAVTLNTPVGSVTMHNAALAANTTVTFTLNNSIIGVTDRVIVTNEFGSANYQAWGIGSGPGSVQIAVRNISAGSLSEAVILGFVVIKGATS
jgi:hypothetical protein